MCFNRPPAPRGKKQMQTFVKIAILLIAAGSVAADEPVLSPVRRAVPGVDEPTSVLCYSAPGATDVVVAGSWDRWRGRQRMHLSPDGVWKLDVGRMHLPPGRHEYKFIVNGAWESGDNRVFFVNGDGLLEKPPGILRRALIQDFQSIEILLSRPVNTAGHFSVRIEPAVPIRKWGILSAAAEGYPAGYTISGELVTFHMSERTYGLRLSPTTRVAVAGNFNHWNPGAHTRWRLKDDDGDHVWELTTPLAGLHPPAGDGALMFKFVVEGTRWLAPPPQAPNVTPDGHGNLNLHLDPQGPGGTTLHIETAAPLNLRSNYFVVVEGLTPRPLWKMLSPGRVLDRFYSRKPLGVILRYEQQATTYRIFAPRARSVDLCIFDGPYYETRGLQRHRIKPRERYPLWMDPTDGVWEISVLGLDTGKYYSFNIDGPPGDGEAFDPNAQVGDPYARAAAQADNNTIVIDPLATNEWFSGWTDTSWHTPPRQDAVIYETHVRDLTIHPSSGVPPRLRGKFAGLWASRKTGTGLAHLRQLGINMIELMPIAEFSNDDGAYNWGYAPVYYFAPEASYGMQPLKGSAYYEFKSLVDHLHSAGFGVILDVVFNHVGSPNIFNLIDKKYFFRLNPDYSFCNFSGCGNDVRTEAPMMRRLITDNIVYWMREHHVDGFRFDLAELIDMDTMYAIRDAARRINPNVLLISEPWSFRGENKYQLKGSGWSAWNNDFRYAAKDFVMGGRNRKWLAKCIFGSLSTWAADPLQPINYLESHDDMTLADELCTRPDRDGRYLRDQGVRADRLAATILFTSLGIPMISEGQEFLRSKRGLVNTYDKGDAINALDWNTRKRAAAAETLEYYRGLIALRRSAFGRSLRVAARPPADYYKWISPPCEEAVGYVVNAGHRHAGAAFVVLLNAATEPVSFEVEFPAGNWRQIADGTIVSLAGLTQGPPLRGPVTRRIEVAPVSSAIFMDGF